MFIAFLNGGEAAVKNLCNINLGRLILNADFRILYSLQLPENKMVHAEPAKEKQRSQKI